MQLIIDAQQKAALKARIESAFADARYPGDDQIIGSYDPPSWDIMALDTRTNFQGKHWRDISPRILILVPDSIWYLTPGAFRFYLPAYMLGLLFGDQEEWLGEKENILDSLRMLWLRPRLDPAKNPQSFAAWAGRVEGLTPQQNEVIQSFLGYVQDVP